MGKRYRPCGVIEAFEYQWGIRALSCPPVGLDEYRFIEKVVPGYVYDIPACALNDEAAALFAVDYEIRACRNDRTGDLVHGFLLPGIKSIQIKAAIIKRKADSSGFIFPPCFPVKGKNGRGRNKFRIVLSSGYGLVALLFGGLNTGQLGAQQRDMLYDA